jgi:pilus assembly protein CpaB
VRLRRPADAGQVRLRRSSWRVRRVASALLVATAFAVAVLGVSRPAPTGSPVLLVAHDLSPGTVVEPDDVTVASRPSGQRPDGALTGVDEALGRVVVSPVRNGEVLTDVRLLGPGLVDALPPGEVATPVRVADAAAAGLVRPGDHVDVLVAIEGQGAAHHVVHAATVLAQPHGAGGGGILTGPADDGRGGLLVLAVGSGEVEALVGAAAQGPLSIAVRGS